MAPKATGDREIPHHTELRDYNRAVAGHAGTLCDADGELFIKPCTQPEIDFYHIANDRYPDFAELMPVFMGTLNLQDPSDVHIEDTVTGLITENGHVETKKEHVAEKVAELAKNISVPEPSPSQSNAEDNITWIPNKSKKIKTSQAVVLENAAHGFLQPNILDVKMGRRLWDHDAPLEKKQRFDKIASETTHQNQGFRIAGMRVYKGSKDSADLDEEDYKIYDKDFGRYEVNDENVVESFRRFIFNKSAGIDRALGQAVCKGFLHELERVQEVLESHESRMYSSSLLFLFEGDGVALESAISEHNAKAEARMAKEKSHPSTKRVDSGIVLEDLEHGEDDLDTDSDDDDEAERPIFALKLIDFAHARFQDPENPNEDNAGPDENVLLGVRSLRRIFEKLASD